MTIYPPAPEDLQWRVSRACDGGACIMVARHGDLVIFGNTCYPDGPFYDCTWAEWVAFLKGAKRGDFDDIAA